MKPIVYLAAFQQGAFNLDTPAPDEPISVSDRGEQGTKRISNCDGEFKGRIPLREALAQSRNTIAVRIGFDDNRSLGLNETGGRVALPIFKEITLRVYRDRILGPVPDFPVQLEQSINAYLKGNSITPAPSAEVGPSKINYPSQF
jgi:membrane carboxypeptidase/penicillin-binding protein